MRDPQQREQYAVQILAGILANSCLGGGEGAS